MRLYQSSTGQWFGTQRDAQRGAPRDWREVEVPTSKQDLINWLSADKSCSSTQDTVEQSPISEEPRPELLSKHAASWVAWALDNLERGDTTSAKEMLKKGLIIQREVS